MAEAFDPDKFLRETAPVAQSGRVSPNIPTQDQGGFDPDKFLQETATAPRRLVDVYKDPNARPHALFQDMTPEERSQQMHALGTVLDYPGGFARTALASGVGLLSGKNVVTNNDWANAVKGRAPRSSEYLERMGVTPGPEVPVPFTDKTINGRDVEGFGLDVATDPLALMARAAKIRPVSAATEAAGKSTYKAGLKNLDLAAARSGKAPVSDVLMANRVTGNSKEIFDKMDALGQNILEARNNILKKATRAGAETDVRSAVAEAQDYVNQLRKTNNPETVKAADMLQSRINDYLGAGAKAPEQVIRELPTSKFQGAYREIKGYKPASDELVDLPTSKMVTDSVPQPEALGYDAPTLSNPGNGSESWSGRDLVQSGAKGRLKFKPNETVTRDDIDKIVSLPQPAKYVSRLAPAKDTGLIQNPGEVLYGREVPAQYVPGRAEPYLDTTERIAGPTPLQTTAWKSSAANRVGEAGYDVLANSSEGRQFDKALASGLRRSTEESVGRSIGPEEAAALKKHNADLGSILSSDEKAYAELEKEARRHGFSSVDGMLATHPAMLATKKVADLAKTGAARTKGGLLMMDVAKTGLLDSAAQRGLIRYLQKKNGLLDQETVPTKVTGDQ